MTTIKEGFQDIALLLFDHFFNLVDLKRIILPCSPNRKILWMKIF
jgi:hypothetical protein